ncbi:MAG: LysM domain-containing protein [Bacilli bacterium]
MRKLFMITLICTILVGLSSFVYAAAFPEEEQVFVTYKVEQGDSIWSIAKQFHQSTENFQELVYDIKKINDVQQFIQPGQELKIPVSSKSI